MQTAQSHGPQSCFHCSLPVPAGAIWQIDFDGQSRPLCCGGCEAVAGTIIAAGLDAFYRQRPDGDRSAVITRELPATLEQAVELGALQADIAWPDSPTSDINVAPAESVRSPELRKIHLVIEGMHCGACVWLLEQGLLAQRGVTNASVNLATERASVTFNANEVTLTQLLTAIARLGYRGSPFEGGQLEAGLAQTNRTNLQRLFVAGIGMMQVMMVALPGYLAGEGDIESQYAGLLRWAALVLTTPVIVYSAWPFFLGAWQTLRFGRLGMDVPVSIGLSAAYLWSVFATVTGQGEVYFDSVAMFVFLLLLARYLQWLIRRQSLAQMSALGAQTPTAARQIIDGVERLVSPTVLEPGDIISVASGRTVPVDAVLNDQATSIDQSVLTGESVPVRVVPGETVAAGSFVCGAPVQFTVKAAVQDSAISQLEGLVASGFESKPRLVLLADRVAARFVLAVILLAVLVWVVWMNLDPSQAWPVAMTVLVVSCPCALSLATPSALSAATGGLIKQGMLVTRPDALEALARATDVVFDKTGTLTQGAPVVTAINTTQSMSRDQALHLAAALEWGSEHPFARAIRQEATHANGEPDGSVIVTEHEAGHGVAGSFIDQSGSRIGLRLGSARWCGLEKTADSVASNNGWPVLPQASEVYLVSVTLDANSPVTVHARFALSDPIRHGAVAEMQALNERGLSLHLLSGDRASVVAAVAEELGITEAIGGVLPAEKQAYVQRLQAQGRRVVMVGDGMNDAPVLSMADASVAVGRASDLARTAADVIALNPAPAALTMLIDRARMTRRVISQNLLWAAIYNGLMIPAAACGWVPPWAAAIGMALSSWLVVANATRLWRQGVTATSQAGAVSTLTEASTAG